MTGNAPLERDKDGYRINKHGLSGYARGCRCDICLRREDDGSFTHGFGPTGKPSGYAQGCRCRMCKDAKAEYGRELRARKAGRATNGPAVQLSADERRDVSIGIRLAPGEKAALEQLAAGDGVPVGTLLREPALALVRERTGHEDTAQRVHQPHRDGGAASATPGGDARDITVGVRFTRIEKSLIEKLAAEDGMPAGQWLREPVLNTLEDRAGYVDMARRRAPRRPNRGDEE